MSASHYLFRVGAIHSGQPLPGQPEEYRLADQVKPTGRVGRSEALYSSLSLSSLAHWHPAERRNQRVERWQLRLQPGADPYCYPVREWEIACARADERAWTEYWTHGVPLSQLALRERIEPIEWEVLISPAMIAGKRPVSLARMRAAAEPHTRDRLRHLRF